MTEQADYPQSERRWSYSREGWPIVDRLDRCCPDYDWMQDGMNMNICGCCSWFRKLEGTKRSYRCLCENRRRKP